MNATRKAQMFGGMTLVAAAGLLVAAGSLAFGPSPVDPYGTTNSGAGRSLLAFPTIVEPNGPNSGTGRALIAFPTIVDPNGPNSGAGHGLS